MVWAFYLALEPFVRKTWPERIIGWSRVLTGRLRDPLVGRDILVGGVWFLANTLLDAAGRVAVSARGMAPPVPAFGLGNALLGTPEALATVLSAVLNAIFLSMFFLLMLYFLRTVVRDRRATAIVLVVIYALWGAASGATSSRVAAGALKAAYGAASLFVLVRFGLLAFMVGRFFVLLATWFPLTLDSSRWFAGNSALAIAAMLATTAYGLALAIRPTSSGRSAE